MIRPVLAFVLTLAAALPAAEERVGVLELTPKAEQAIDRGLQYLAAVQASDGSWGEQYIVGHTAFALMAFMVQGHVPGHGPYGRNMDRAIDYLVGQAKKYGGYIADDTSAVTYQHGLAVMALAEAWGQAKRPELRDIVKNGVDIIMRAQSHVDGGWRYEPKPAQHGGDLSITVSMVQALASAKEAGILVPDHVLDKARNFVYACQDQAEGYFGYRPSQKRGGTTYLSGSGALTLQLAGDRDSAALQRGLRYMRFEHGKDGFEGCREYFVAHYYCTQASYQAGDDYVNFWYPRIRQQLLARQQADGSWPGGDNIHPSLNTAASVLILGLPYRFLPLYQR